MQNKLKKHELVAERILALIASNKLAAGDRLPGELQLARMFQTARPTVRVALITLEIRDVVEIRSGSGTYVRPQGCAGRLELPDEVAPMEALRARCSIEVPLAAEACGYVTEARQQEVRMAMDDLLSPTMTWQSLLNADLRFHVAIARCANSEILAELLSFLLPLTALAGVGEHVSADILQSEREDHERLYRAIRDRCCRSARESMRSHLRHLEEMLMFGHTRNESLHLLGAATLSPIGR